ncbi:MAG TPA: hypothetical protein V6C71_26105 [Coleofasciculaceae cyanobacterium]|jgi:hypothetical protein
MKRILFGLLAIISPLFLGFLVWRYSVNVPFWDQWDTPGKLIVEASQGKLTWEQLMRQHNESRTFFPNLVFLNLARLTNWNTRFEMLVTFLLACLVSFNIYRLGKITLNNHWQHLICFSLANLWIFSPKQYENWLWGFQGITFISIAAITTALVVIFSSLPRIIKLIVSLVLSAIATFSFANGLLCWIIIFPALLLKLFPKKVSKIWLFFGWLTIFSTFFTVYLHDYHQPSHSPSLSQVITHPLLAVNYYTALLGSPLFSQSLLDSQIKGGVILIIFTCFCGYLWRQRRNTQLINQSFPWLLIGFYVLLSAGLITAGRMNLGTEFALSSRYITFSTYLLVTLIYLFAIVLSHVRHKLILGIIATLLTILLLLSYKNSLALGINLFTKTHYQRVYGKTCLLTINVIEDKECIAEYIYPNPNKLAKQAQKINQLGLLQPKLIQDINWQDNQKLSQENLLTHGEFASLTRTQDDSYVASGWAFALSDRPSFDAVILAYQVSEQPPKAFAIAPLNMKTKDILGLLLNRKSIKLTWEKTFSTLEFPPPQSRITAWAFDTNDAKAYPLKNTQTNKHYD